MLFFWRRSAHLLNLTLWKSGRGFLNRWLNSNYHWDRKLITNFNDKHISLQPEWTCIRRIKLCDFRTKIIVDRKQQQQQRIRRLNCRLKRGLLSDSRYRLFMCADYDTLVESKLEIVGFNWHQRKGGLLLYCEWGGQWEVDRVAGVYLFSVCINSKSREVPQIQGQNPAMPNPSSHSAFPHVH